MGNAKLPSPTGKSGSGTVMRDTRPLSRMSRIKLQKSGKKWAQHGAEAYYPAPQANNSPTSDLHAALTWIRTTFTIIPTSTPAATARLDGYIIRPFAEESGAHLPRRRRSNRPGISQAPGTAKAMTVWKAK